MEPPTPSLKGFTSTIINNNNNSNLKIKLSSSEKILSLSTELNGKKYRLVISQKELQNSHNFFKQFCTFEQIISAFIKIISSSNNIVIDDKEINIKFNNFLDEKISIKIPEEKNDIDLLYLNLKKLEIENNNLKEVLLNSGNDSKKKYNKRNLNSIKDSVILKDNEDMMIKNWIGHDKNMSFNLIYKATRDGDDVKDFHKLCDEISPTLTLARTKNGNRFGGYTCAPLKRNADVEKIYDKNAFVFSIDKQYKYNTNKPEEAVHSRKEYGPYFGSNSPFYIGNKFLTQNSSYSNPDNDYKSPPYALTGAERYTLDELEVYTINFE